MSEVVVHAPKVSIGLPVYNGENFIAEAIACVKAQTFEDWELVISDNASTDRTVEICRELAENDPRVRLYVQKQNLGVSPNYDQVFHLSRGRYFAWLAHDDLIHPEFVASCLREREATSNAVLVFPRTVHVDRNRCRLRATPLGLSVCGPTAVARVERLVSLEIHSTDIFWSQFGLMRRAVLGQTRLMDTYPGGDQVLLLDLAIRGDLKQIDGELFFRREHAGASTLRKGWSAKEKAVFAYAEDSRRLVFPYCRMLKEHVSCIRRSSISSWAKMRCVTAVGKRFLRQWKDIVLEIVPPLGALKPKKEKMATPLTDKRGVPLRR